MLFQQNVAFGWCLCATWVHYYYVRCQSRVIKWPENEWEQSCEGINLSTAHWQPGLLTKTRRLTQSRSSKTWPSDLQWSRDWERQRGGEGKDFILLFLAGERGCPGHGKSQSAFLTAPSEPDRHFFTWNPSVRLCGCFVTTVPTGETWATGVCVFQVQSPVGPQKGPCALL